MKKTMIRSLTYALGLIMLVALAEIGTAAAASVSLSNITVPAGQSRNSAGFRVRNRGTFTVRVRVRTNTLLGYGGRSSYRVRLMRGNAILATRNMTTGSSYRTVTFVHTVTNCNQTNALYRINVRNTSTDNPQQAIASFPTFQVPDLTPVTGNMSLFGVTQGNTITRTIPSHLRPSGTGGRIIVTATWDGVCGLNAAGCRLIFRLRRGATVLRTSNGYAHNALFGNANPKMTINYLVPANQVGGSWTLRITGSQSGSVSNVRPKVTFTPRCQNP